MTSLSRAECAVGPGDDPREAARRLRRAREAALGSGSGPERAVVRPVIGASWRRLQAGGLDPTGRGPGRVLDGADLRGRREETPMGEVLPLLRRHLLPAAEAAGQVLVVADAAGTVLWREGNVAARRRADTLGFDEGSAWDEASVGTNAIGTSLVVGAPVHVFAAEHYVETHQPWTCAAAPVRGPDGTVAGVVDLSGPAPGVHASTIALVQAVAALAERELVDAHGRRHARLAAQAAALIGDRPGAVLATDGCRLAAVGMLLPERVDLGRQARPGGIVALAEAGTLTVEAVPGGWLLRPGDRQGASTLHLAPDGRVDWTGGGSSWSQRVSPRHRDLLLDLAAHPGGSSAADLARRVYDDPARTVTVRAELSRLRRVLGPVLEHRPYRLAAGVRVVVGA
ncbi:GAF domain-containing protein [Kineococcus gynurae]|uniref:GAF domain-containing protein n=1 Tax=Kineococcus gynurae TaxID=452979 RepID=A0ABV5LTA1_9ACTN